MKQFKILKGPTCAVVLCGYAYAQEINTTLNALEESEVIADDAMALFNTSQSSRFFAPIDELPRSIEIVTNEAFTSKGALSVEDTLRYLPGVYTGVFGLDTRIDTYQIRGVTPARYQDGFLHADGFYNIPRADIYSVEQVEVIKGPAGVQFGQGTIGGVVNTVSKVAKEGEFGEVNLQYGNNDRYQVSLDKNGKLNKDGTLFFRVVGSFRESGTQTDFVDDDSTLLLPSITWKPTENTTLTASYRYQNTNTGSTLQFLPFLDPNYSVPDNADATLFIGENDYDRFDSDVSELNLIFNHRFNEVFSLRANARYTTSDSVYAYHQLLGPTDVFLIEAQTNAGIAAQLGGTLPAGFGVSFPQAAAITGNPYSLYRTAYYQEQESDVFGSNIISTAEFSTGGADHTLNFGLDFLTVDRSDARPVEIPGFNGFFNSGVTGSATQSVASPAFSLGTFAIYDPSNPESFGAPVVPELTSLALYDVERIGISLTDSIKYGNWIVNLGARYDTVEQTVGGNIDASREDSEASFDAGVIYKFANGFSPYYSYSEGFDVNGPDNTGNLVDPRTVKGHELGFKYMPESGRTLITGAAFYYEEENRNSNSFAIQALNDTQIAGFELGVVHKFHDFFFQGSATFLDAKQQAVDGLTPELELDNVPDTNLGLWVQYEPSSGALKDYRMGLGARYTSAVVSASNAIEGDNATIFDLMVGRRFGNFDVQLNVNNLFDEDYIAGVADPLLAVTSYGARRTIVLSATYDF